MKSVALLSLVGALTAGAAQAEIIHFSATLAPADATGAKPDAAQGELTAEVETAEKTFVYRAAYAGLSGPATAAGFRGPVAMEPHAPVLAVEKPASPVYGAVLLTVDDVDNLLAGKWSFTVQTRAHPHGEIAGALRRLN